MNSKLFLGLISIPLIGLAAWTAYTEYKSHTMPEVTVNIQGFDPRSILSGHYIAYRINWEKTDCRQFTDNECPKNDFDKSDSWNYGRHRFYIPQERAKELEERFNNAEKNQDTFEVVYAYKKGFKPIAKRLLINGEIWQNALKK